MRLNTLFQTCVYFTIIMLIFTLCVNFVSFLDIFGTVDTGVDVDLNDNNETFETISGNPIGNIWGSFTSATGLATMLGLGGSIVVGALIRSPVVIGIGLFSTIFWASYINMIGILDFGGFMPPQLLAIAHGAMLFIWAGSVVGMLSGSG